MTRCSGGQQWVMVKSKGWKDEWSQLLICPRESTCYGKSLNLFPHLSKGCDKIQIERSRWEEHTMPGWHRSGVHKARILVKSKMWDCIPFLFYVHLSFRNIIFHRNMNWLDISKVAWIKSCWSHIAWFEISVALTYYTLTKSLRLSVAWFHALKNVRV